MIKTAGFLASAMVNGMDLGSIAAGRSQSFQEIEEKRGMETADWRTREKSQKKRKKKRQREMEMEMERGGGDWFQSQEEGGGSEYELDGDRQKEGRQGGGERLRGESERESERVSGKRGNSTKTLKTQAPKTKSTKLDSFGQLG